MAETSAPRKSRGLVRSPGVRFREGCGAHGRSHPPWIPGCSNGAVARPAASRHIGRKCATSRALTRDTRGDTHTHTHTHIYTHAPIAFSGTLKFRHFKLSLHSRRFCLLRQVRDEPEQFQHLWVFWGMLGIHCFGTGIGEGSCDFDPLVLMFSSPQNRSAFRPIEMFAIGSFSVKIWN